MSVAFLFNRNSRLLSFASAPEGVCLVRTIHQPRKISVAGVFFVGRVFNPPQQGLSGCKPDLQQMYRKESNSCLPKWNKSFTQMEIYLPMKASMDVYRNTLFI